MAEAHFTISAFGDEIADDLEEQLQVLRRLEVGYLDLRAAWGTGVLALDDAQVERVGQMCGRYGVRVSCIGSPVGKTPISAPREMEMDNLARIFRIAEALGTRRVRVFSFYPPAGTPPGRFPDFLPESIARLSALAEMAGREGFQLYLENEKGIVGDTIDRCARIMRGVSSPYMQFLWDPANFVQVGEAEQTTRGWPLLGERLGYVHIKDARLADHGVTVAGAADGQVPELLTHLKEAGYQGFLGVEPHLVIAGHSSGYSAPEGMARAVTALRDLMGRLGCQELRP